MKLEKVKTFILLILLIVSTISYADDLPPTDDPPISDDAPPTDDPSIAAAPIDTGVDLLFIAGLIFAGKVYFDRNNKRFNNCNFISKKNNQ